MSFPQILLLSLNSPQLSQPVLTGKVLHPLDPFVTVLWTLTFQQFYIQDMVGFLGCKGTLLPYAQLAIH